MPEQPHRSNLPPVFDAYWEPIIRACAETQTVLNLHNGSSGFAQMPAGAPMLELGATMFGPMAITSCAEWLWSGWPARYPELRIAMSEGGIGWVAMLIDRLDNIMTRSGYGSGWPDKKNSPTDVLRRNFWFCMIEDASTICTRHTIGVDNILFESDYPHGDGTWPDTQKVIERGARLAARGGDPQDHPRERGARVPAPAAEGVHSRSERFGGQRCRRRMPPARAAARP